MNINSGHLKNGFEISRLGSDKIRAIPVRPNIKPNFTEPDSTKNGFETSMIPLKNRYPTILSLNDVDIA